MAARIQIRRDFSSNWTLNNPILTEGEIGYELDSGKLKIGDGTKNWNSLSYFQETVNYSDVVDPPINLSYFNDDVGYLLETSPAGSVTNSNILNWNTAYSWGNHASAGYLTTASAASTYLTIANAATTYQPVDGDLTAIAGLTGTSGLLRKTAANTWALDTTQYLTSGDIAAGITNTQITNWEEAYSWGNHAVAGYLLSSTAATTYQPYDADLEAISDLTSTGFLKRTGANTWTLDNSTYLTTETDPVYSASVAAGITSGLVNNWNTAYSWGDHAVAGYLSTSTAATTYQPLDGDLTAIAGISATSGLLRKTAANTWSLDTNTYLTTADASTTYQPVDADLTAIAGLSGTTGLLQKTAANTWTLNTNQYARIVAAPATPTSTGTAGDISYGADYLYVCIGTDTWKRIAWDNGVW